MNNAEMIARKINSPISIELLGKLFKHLDNKVKPNISGGMRCRHNHDNTVRFLQEKGVGNVHQVVSWLKEYGGYCDCEVLLNSRPNLAERINRAYACGE